jgi:hypothetical protein
MLSKNISVHNFLFLTGICLETKKNIPKTKKKKNNELLPVLVGGGARCPARRADCAEQRLERCGRRGPRGRSRALRARAPHQGRDAQPALVIVVDTLCN